MNAPRPKDPLVSIVVPVLDEEGCIEELTRRVREALVGSNARYQLLFVDDGSRDRTPELIAALQAGDARVCAIHFTRSFGHQAALSAGLRYARGDLVITMDGDLQHPPELLPDLIAAWRGGADVVHTRRRRPRGSRSGVKEQLGRAFYRAINRLSRVPIQPAGADFRLLDRRVVDAFNRLDEHFVFVRGLVPWLGFRETVVDYEVGSRFAGRSKYRLSPMLRLAFDGLLAFSVIPLRLITLLGLATTVAGLGYGAYWVVAFLMGKVAEPGLTSIVVLLLVFGGVQLLSLGIASEYIGRIYEEVKHRPRYVIDSMRGIDAP